MTIKINPDLINPHPTADTAETLLKKLIAMVEEDFVLPAILKSYNIIEIQPWQLERIAVSVAPMPDTTGDLRMNVQRQIRYGSPDAPRRYTSWENVPANCMERIYEPEPVVRDAVESRPEEDLRSFLTAWLTRSDMTHLIR